MTVYLCQSAFAFICDAAATAGWRETGGILLGYETADDIVITQATGPGPNAIRTRGTVELDLEYIRKVTAQANDRDLQYQGSWHRHPVRRGLVPSRTDRDLLRQTANSSNYRLTTAIMLITTARPQTIDDLHVIVCKRGQRTIRRARPILSADP